MNEYAGREQEIEAREKAATLVVRLRQGVVGVHYTSEEAADRIEVLETQLRGAREKLAAAKEAIRLVRSAESYDGIMHGATSRRAWEGLDRILKGGD